MALVVKVRRTRFDRMHGIRTKTFCQDHCFWVRFILKIFFFEEISFVKISFKEISSSRRDFFLLRKDFLRRDFFGEEISLGKKFL